MDDPTKHPDSFKQTLAHLGPGPAPVDEPVPVSVADPDIPVDIDRSSGPPPVSKVDPYVGRTIDGRYVVEAVLGEGGMGVVYRGRHKVIDKKVAIKVLRGEMARDKEITERFLQEARAASSIGNPHIVDISDFGTLPDGSTYFVMEYLAGQSLGAIMEAVRPVPVARLLHLGKQVAAGLAAAHEAGIVHRDLKPDNVIIVDRGTEKDFAKILDFGIAKVGGEGSKLTRAGAVFGTPHYMSPEQAAGTPVDQRTDIYALGVILYEMASGKVPFDADNFMGILTQHMYKKPPWIRELVPMPDVPPGLDAVIQKCLSKKPEGRYESMGGLIADLEKIEQGRTPEALAEMMGRSGGFSVPADYYRPSAMPVPVPGTPAGVPKSGRMPLYVGIGVVATIALAAIAASFIPRESQSSAQPLPDKTTGLVATATTPVAPPTVAITPPPIEPVVATKQVVILPEPPTATITRDGTTIANNIVVLKEGEVANLVVSAPGFVDATLKVDGTDLKPVVHLHPKAGPAQPPHQGSAAPQPPPQQSPTQVGGVSDPWATPSPGKTK